MTPFTRRAFILSAASLYLVPPALAGQKRVSTGADGVALQGYDTRAYWDDATARKGSDTHQVDWNGVPWHFATKAEAESFAASPARFAPQFGGFCTRAMSFKKVVDGDPEVWRIFEGKLYLFAQPKGGKAFDKSAAPMIAKAQAHWDSLG